MMNLVAIEMKDWLFKEINRLNRRSDKDQKENRSSYEDARDAISERNSCYNWLVQNCKDDDPFWDNLKKVPQSKRVDYALDYYRKHQ